MAEKKYYWLKLKEGFFGQTLVKKLRKIAGGDTYVIIYLKMQLLGLRTEGRFVYEGIGDSFVEELALQLEEEEENVKVTLLYLERAGMIEVLEDESYFMPSIVEATGSESTVAERVRKCREQKRLGISGEIEEKEQEKNEKNSKKSEKNSKNNEKKGKQEESSEEWIEQEGSIVEDTEKIYKEETLCSPLQKSGQPKAGFCEAKVMTYKEGTVCNKEETVCNGDEILCNEGVLHGNGEMLQGNTEIREREREKKKDICPSGEGRANNGKAELQWQRFERFWEKYPRKTAKKEAQKAWKKLKIDVGLYDEIEKALEQQKLSEEWLKEKGRFVPYPASWLNGERWKDILPETVMVTTREVVQEDGHLAKLKAMAARSGVRDGKV